MSIHAAKGLEFPVVCVADLGRAPNLRVPDLLVDGERVGPAAACGSTAPTRCRRSTSTSSSEERQRRAGRGGGPDPVRRDDARARAAAAERRGRLRALARAAPRAPRSPGSARRWLPSCPALAGALERPPCTISAVGAAGAATVRCRLNAPATRRARCCARGTDAAAGAQPALRLRSRGARPLGARRRARQRAISTQPASASLERLARARGRRDSLSYTTLSELERCGYRYYLERVLGLRRGRAAARAHGRAGRPAGAGARHARAPAARVGSTSRAPRDAVVGGGRAARARARRARAARASARRSLALVGSVSTRGARPVADRAARVAAARSARAERPFAFALGPRRAADQRRHRPARARGRRRLRWWSTTRATASGATRTSRRSSSATTSVQRLIYALAVLRDGAPRVEVVHWFLRASARAGSARATRAADRGELEERLAARLERAHARAFAVSEHPHRGLCETCPGRGGLCSWSDAETLRETPRAERADEVHRERPGEFASPMCLARRFLRSALLRFLAPPQVPACLRTGGRARTGCVHPRGMHRPNGALP